MSGFLERDKFHFSYFTDEYAEEAIKLLTYNFVFLNSIWKKLGVKQEEGKIIMKERVAYALDRPWSTMMVNKIDKVLVNLQITYDLYDYVNNKIKVPYHAPWMDAIGEVAADLENDYFKSLNPKRGEYLYGDSAAANPKYITKKSTQIFWSESMAHFKYCGYKAVFIRSTNPRSTKLMINLGGKQLRNLPMRREQVKDESISLVRIDLDDLNVKSLHELYGQSDE